MLDLDMMAILVVLTVLPPNALSYLNVQLMGDMRFRTLPESHDWSLGSIHDLFQHRGFFDRNGLHLFLVPLSTKTL